MRFSDWELAYIIYFCIEAIKSWIFWDTLKKSIKKIFSSNDIKRKWSIVIRMESKEIICFKNYYCMRENATDMKFEDINTLFEFMKKNNEK